MINDINMLDASEYLCNPATGKSIVRLMLRNLLYRITLENKAPPIPPAESAPIR
jgi:hypothetical protein